LRAFVITLLGHAYSEACAARCIESGREIGGIQVEKFEATNAHDAEAVMRGFCLRWTWGQGFEGLTHHAYPGRLAPRIGCAMSHYRLWMKCVVLDEPLLILEHDSVFLRRLPFLTFDGICQINDPNGATPRGLWWSQRMANRGVAGVFEKTVVFTDGRPDGLAGNSAYVIKPHAARALVEKVREVGVWPNDATICRQFFPLQELYPFVTRVEQTQSTTSA
jgi:GR25 family glycosyltransferase involved in LPS biosynthesis